MNKSLYLLILASGFLIFSNYSQSCTSVFANDKGPIKVVARSMDLFVSDKPLIKVHPRGKSWSGGAVKNPLSWQSKFGSVVITAFHSSAVSDGINEKGLAAHLLYLSESDYSKTDKNKNISNTLWAQYILDNFATVKEALAGSQNLNLIPTEVEGRAWPVHLAIEDSTGDSAVIEFIKGKIQVYQGKEYQVMTNEPAYSVQLANLKKYKGFGGNLPLPGDSDPLSRFVRVASYLKTLPSATTEIESIAGILSVIRTAMVPFGAVDTSGNNTEDAWPTRWVTVADLSNKLYFFNATTTPNIIWIDLKAINFTENAHELSINPLTIDLEGNITKKLTSTN